MHIHHIEGYIQSIYLVEYDDKLMLLDGCCRCDVAVVETFITQQLKRPMSDLKLVLVSHMHPDHGGGAHLFRKRFGCQIASVRSNTQWYGGVRGAFSHLTDTLLALYVARRKGKALHYVFYPRKLRPDILLTEGEPIPDFTDWTVYETPGHTDRDLSFYHAASKQIYVGDVILKLKSRFVSPFPIYQPDVYRASLAKLMHLDIDTIIMAHDGFSAITNKEIQSLIEKSPKRPLTASIVAKYKLKKLLVNKK